MPSMTRILSTIPIATLILLAGCSPRRVHEEPILRNGDRVSVDAPPAGAHVDPDRAHIMARRDSLAAAALAACDSTDACDALARGEIALGMTETQVLAATGTTEDAWVRRDAEHATVLIPRYETDAPADGTGRVAVVHLQGDRVSSYAYRESQGLRTVSDPAEASSRGRAEARGRALLSEGDDLAARGELGEALDRYDRADILLPEDPMVAYRIATVLEKQLRPIEALVQYRLFLHELDLERIEAVGRAHAELADAIARARERIIVLERSSP